MFTAGEDARRRGEELKATLLISLEWLHMDAAALELKCTVDEVQSYLDDNLLIAVEHNGQELILRDLILQGRVTPGLDQVLGDLDSKSPWWRLIWLTTPK